MNRIQDDWRYDVCGNIPPVSILVQAFQVATNVAKYALDNLTCPTGAKHERNPLKKRSENSVRIGDRLFLSLDCAPCDCTSATEREESEDTP